MTREEAINEIKSWDFLEGKEIEAIQTIVPELAENDDERIREEMIRYFTEMKKGGSAALPYDDCIAYLERQKETGIRWFKSDEVKNPDKPYIDKAGMFYTTDGRMCYTSEIEKQKEQKPKIYIPKFRDGDKIKLKGSNLDLTITNIEGSRYYGKGWSLDIVSADESYELVEQKSAEINEYEIIKKHITHDVLSSEVNKRLKECEWYVTDEKPAEWDEDYNEENIQTRFAFYTYKDDPCTLYLSNVFVNETSRNKGFGTKILTAAEKVAETFGVTYIRLKVKQGSPANAWYRKNGYGYVAFEDGYDWLEKNLEYVKSNKQEWDKFDEDCLKRAVWYIENPAPSVVKDTNLALWLKLLPRRFNLESKQQWREEDEKLIDDVTNSLCCYQNTISDYQKEIVGAEIRKLKSFHERFVLQSKQQLWRHYTWHNQMRFDYDTLVKYENRLGYEIVTSGNKPSKEVNGEYIFLKDICLQSS